MHHSQRPTAYLLDVFVVRQRSLDLLRVELDLKHNYYIQHRPHHTHYYFIVSRVGAVKGDKNEYKIFITEDWQSN